MRVKLLEKKKKKGGGGVKKNREGDLASSGGCWHIPRLCNTLNASKASFLRKLLR